MTLRIVLTDATGMQALGGVFGNFLKSSNAQIQQAVIDSQAAATAAQLSATNADHSASASAASASASASSATNAATSASAAAGSQGAAATSATNASNSAAAAAASQSAAATSETNAGVSATNAGNSAGVASSAASAASTSASNAATSATNAANSAAAFNTEFTINTTGGTTTLSTADAANGIFVVKGVLASNATIVYPATPHAFTIQNLTTGGFSVTAKAAGQTPSASVLQGKATNMFADATGVYATSSVTGMQYAGISAFNGNATLGIAQLGAMVMQTGPASTTTLPKANTFPAGSGIGFTNYSGAAASFTVQGGDTCDLATPYSTESGDVFFLYSDGTSIWRLGHYTNKWKPKFDTGIKLGSGGITFSDGSVQTTATAGTAPTSTLYSVAIGNVALGATQITTAGFVDPFITIYRNGLRLTRGVDWSPVGDNLKVNLLNYAVGNKDEFEFLTGFTYNPSTVYVPSSTPLTPAFGVTSISSVPYTTGFVRLYRNGARLVPNQDFSATDGTNINFLTFAGDGVTLIEVEVLTPLTFGNSVSASNPVLLNPLTFADGTVQGTAPVGLKNRIINGDARVTQYAAAANSTTAGTRLVLYSGPDRWRTGNGAGGSFTQSQGNMVVGGVNKFSVLQTVNTISTNLTGTNSWDGICQFIEGLNAHDLTGQPFVVSFWFQASLAGQYTVAIRDSSSAFSYLYPFTVVANTPTKIIVPVPANASLTIPNNNGNGLILGIGALNTGTSQSSSTNQWLTGLFLSATGNVNWSGTVGATIAASEIQLEAGSVATPFERRPVGMELALCQRYYQDCPYGVSCNVNSGSSYSATMNFRVPMRATPTAVQGTVNAVNNFPSSAPTYNMISNTWGLATKAATATAAAGFLESAWLSAEL